MFDQDRPLWYGLDGELIDIATANSLLRDIGKRQLAATRLVTNRGVIEVSTVFLVLDANLFGDGPPILWETMVFGGPLDLGCWQYETREQALVGHGEAVTWARAELDLKRVAVIADETVGTSVEHVSLAFLMLDKEQ